MADRGIGGLWPLALAIIALSALAEQARNRQQRAGLNPADYSEQNAVGCPPSGAVEGGRIDSPDRRRNFIVVILKRISKDNLTLVDAGVAFYTLLALFPAMAILVSLYGMI